MEVLLENLQVLFEDDVILLVWKYSVFGSFSGGNTLSKIVAFLYKRAKLDLRLTKLLKILTRKFVFYIKSNKKIAQIQFFYVGLS